MSELEVRVHEVGIGTLLRAARYSEHTAQSEYTPQSSKVLRAQGRDRDTTQSSRF